jgi:hypothetical protein
VELLLDAGADRTIAATGAYGGETAVDWAKAGRRKSIVALLSGGGQLQQVLEVAEGGSTRGITKICLAWGTRGLFPIRGSSWWGHWLCLVRLWDVLEGRAVVMRQRAAGVASMPPPSSPPHSSSAHTHAAATPSLVSARVGERPVTALEANDVNT